jgi:multidrug resistance efflux pump
VLIGAVLSLATVGLGFWPITAAESADGVFSRYSRATIIESRIAGAVVAIHVRPGQHVAAGAQLVTLRSEAVERELSDIDAKLEQLRRSRDIVQSEQRAQPSELEVRRSQTLAEVEARLALTRSELAAIEDKRDALLASAAQSDIAPLKLSALDDRVDVARTALRAASAQRKSLEEQPRQSEADPALETGALARESLRLQERRSALERKRQSAGVEAPAAGVVAQLLPSVGDTVPDAAPMVRVIPAGVSPSLVVSLDALDASALGDTTSAPTEVNLSAAHGVISFETRVVRVTREAPQASADHAAGSAMLVELMLNDAAQAAALVVALAQDPAISLHYRRELPLASWIFTRLSSDT